MTWRLIIESFLQRLLVSTSYSAVTRIQNIMKTQIPSYLGNGAFFIAAIFTFLACSIYFDSSEGLKIVFSMLSAQILTSNLPIPQEPISYLVLPGILLYFSSVSSVIWIINSICSSNDNLRAAALSIIDYVILFAASRGLARFKATDQMHTLGILSLVYLINPPLLQLSNKNTTNKNTNSWIFHFTSVIECLSVRGATLWITLQINASFTASSIVSMIAVNLFLLVWNPFAINEKLKPCAGVVSFISAQQISSLCQSFVDSHISASMFLVVLTWLTYLHTCPHFLCDICKLGASISLTTWLESWTKTVNPPSEAFFVYIFIFLLIEKSLSFLKSLSRVFDFIYGFSEKNNAITASIITLQPSSNNNDQNNINDYDSRETNAILDESISGIAHASTLVGLPQVNDNSGQH